MIVTQNTKLNAVPGGIIPVVHVSQFDVNRAISFTIFDGNAPAVLDSGTTVTIEGTKPDGHGFAYTGTLVDNVATFNTTEQMTVLSGSIECKLVLSLNSQVIGTAMFILDIEKAAIDGNTDISDTEIPAIIELASQQESNAEAWANGTRGGEPTEPTDPTYHKDSRYWAEYAESAVTGVTGVKGNAEETYRRGNVNLTPADLGALALDGDSKDNTTTFTSSDNDATTANTTDGMTSVTTLSSGETHESLFQKISKMFLNIRKLWNTVGETDISDVGQTVTGAIANLAGTVLYTSDTGAATANTELNLSDDPLNYDYLAIEMGVSTSGTDGNTGNRRFVSGGVIKKHSTDNYYYCDFATPTCYVNTSDTSRLNIGVSRVVLRQTSQNVLTVSYNYSAQFSQGSNITANAYLNLNRVYKIIGYHY